MSWRVKAYPKGFPRTSSNIETPKKKKKKEMVEQLLQLTQAFEQLAV